MENYLLIGILEPYDGDISENVISQYIWWIFGEKSPVGQKKTSIYYLLALYEQLGKWLGYLP